MATEEELYRMSDADLEAAFRAAKAEEASPDTDYEQDVDMEQPEVDSDDNSSEEESELDTDTESEEELVEDEDLEDTQEEVESTEEAKEQPAQKRVYRANGRDYEFTDEEIFAKFGQVFGQAMDYTKKMQQIKPWRKTIDAIEQAQLSEDDLNLAIDVLKGDKNAIAAVLKRTGIDALEIDTDLADSYRPTNYGRSSTELAIKDIVEEIRQDKEYEITYDVLQNQWDAKSRQEFAEKPELIKQLHIDVKSGMFEKIAPIAQKIKVFDGAVRSDLDYYKIAAQQYFNELARKEDRQKTVTNTTKVAQVKTEAQKREAVKTESAKRKAAAPAKQVAGASKVVDYLDTSDEAFEEWYNKLQDSR